MQVTDPVCGMTIESKKRRGARSLARSDVLFLLHIVPG